MVLSNKKTVTREKQLMYYTVEEVAKILRVSPPTVRKLIREGQLKAVRVGVQIRIRKEDLDRFLESQSL
jgi:excisionase family DNA binding protein